MVPLGFHQPEEELPNPLSSKLVVAEVDLDDVALLILQQSAFEGRDGQIVQLITFQIKLNV